MDNFVPILSQGVHDTPQEGACVMEMVSFMSGDQWTDLPTCSSAHIAFVAQAVNDCMSDRNRHMILTQFDRLFGTSGHDDSFEFVNELREYFFNKHLSIDKSNGARERSGRIAKQVMSLNFFGAVVSIDYTLKTQPELIDDRDELLLGILKDVLDIFDRVTGREAVEPQNLAELAFIPGQVKAVHATTA